MCCSIETSRSHRVAILLGVLCVLHAFDLGFTRAQMVRPDFAEMNKLAQASFGLTEGTGGATAYKSALFGAGVLILLKLRRHWQAEAGTWFLLIVSVGLMLWWDCYLDQVEMCLADPAVITANPGY